MTDTITNLYNYAFNDAPILPKYQYRKDANASDPISLVLMLIDAIQHSIAYDNDIDAFIRDNRKMLRLSPVERYQVMTRPPSPWAHIIKSLLQRLQFYTSNCQYQALPELVEHGNVKAIAHLMLNTAQNFMTEFNSAPIHLVAVHVDEVATLQAMRRQSYVQPVCEVTARMVLREVPYVFYVNQDASGQVTFNSKKLTPEMDALMQLMSDYSCYTHMSAYEGIEAKVMLACSKFVSQQLNRVCVPNMDGDFEYELLLRQCDAHNKKCIDPLSDLMK